MAKPISERPERVQPGSAPGGADNRELASVKHLLTVLDKTFRTARIYGANNPVVKKFVRDFYRDLTAHLTAHDSLTFLVQRFELLYKGEVVYQNTSPTENLAFKLYSDGIRELAFNQGLSQEDLSYFLETLGGEYDAENAEDDIVTRLWEKDLSTISMITAEEIVKAPESAEVLTPQDAQTLDSPVSRLREVRAAEAARQKQDEASGKAKPKSGFKSGLPGFDVSDEELEKLARDIGEESARVNNGYVMDVLAAILASEKSEVVLSRLLDAFGESLETLPAEGNWKLLNQVLEMLQQLEARPDLAEDHRKKLSNLFAGLGQPDRIRSMAGILNRSPEQESEGLLAFLLQLNSDAVPSLCELLGDLEHQHHRLVVCEALVKLAKESPEPLVRGLKDSRWFYVRNLIVVIGRLGNPRLAEPLEQLARHPDGQVRKEAVRTLGILCPSGNGSGLVGFLNDSEGSIRLSALKLLGSGNYTVPFSAWTPIVTRKEFLDRSTSEKRATFLAMSQTVGEQAVPYWLALVTQWLLTNRRKREELGALAAEALGREGTAAAVAALKAGRKRLNKTIRNACTVALTALMKRQREQKKQSLQA